MDTRDIRWKTRAASGDSLEMIVHVTWRRDPPPKKMPMVLWKLPQGTPGTAMQTFEMKRRGSLEQAVQFFHGTSALNGVLNGARSKVGDKGHILRVSVTAEGTNGKNYILAQWNAWSERWGTAIDSSARNWIPDELVEAVTDSVARGFYI